MDLSIFALSQIVVSLKVTYLANFFALLIVISAISVLLVMPKYKLSSGFYALFGVLNGALF